MKNRKVIVFGGGGYVGSVLIPKLLQTGIKVSVFDTFWYGKDVFSPAVSSNPNLTLIQDDIRNIPAVASALLGVTDVIHLACISNDPSFDLNPELGKSINLDCFMPLVVECKKAGVQRFIYASSSSVYGVKEEERVTEELILEPLTDYSKFKAACELTLLELASPDFVCTVLRPATVCGVSTRQRFDLSVNILTNHAINKGKITVFGGTQHRPNLHIQDMADSYIHVLQQPEKKVSSKIYNVGGENLSLDEIAEKVKTITGVSDIVHEPTDDLRSYRVDSSKIAEDLGFYPTKSVDNAIEDLAKAFQGNLYSESLSSSRYFNIKRMQELALNQ